LIKFANFVCNFG